MTDAWGGLRAALHDWYAEVARDLPWRRTRDPYALLVSEVMCQQTQVARVVPRYEAWLERWPTAAALAAAPVGEVLGAWVGLGYNRRALRLREACVAVARDGWPADAAGLRALPGIGPYTAAAVASFAWDERIAAVDVNVERVCARLGGPAPQELLDPLRPAASNQAAMELGALVCRARSPRCDACPVAAWCASAGVVTTAPRGAGRPRERFEDTNRYVRGRIVAAVHGGEELPADLHPDRVRAALEGLVADGLIDPGAMDLPLG